MKKVAAILLAVAMTVCLMAGCGAETVTPNIAPYDQLNYEEYLELPD